MDEFNVMIPEPRATLQGGKIPSAIIENRSAPYFILLLFSYATAVWASASGGFCIVSDTLVSFYFYRSMNSKRTLNRQNNVNSPVCLPVRPSFCPSQSSNVSKGIIAQLSKPHFSPVLWFLEIQNFAKNSNR